LGGFFQPGTLAPLARLCDSQRIQAKVMYSALQGITRPQASQFIRDAAACNISLRPVRDPRAHAKIRTWDGNTAVITSQN
jgi:hypothetical protein